MAKGGWIKLYRNLMDNPLWQDNLMLKAWIDLLLRASHKDSKFLFRKKFIVVSKGQMITSQRKLAESWMCCKDTVKTILDKFKDERMITYEADSEKTLITIVNYNIYQDNKSENTDSDSDSYQVSYSDAFQTQGRHEVDSESPHSRRYKNDYKNDINNAQEKKNSASGGRSIFGGEWEE